MRAAELPDTAEQPERLARVARQRAALVLALLAFLVFAALATILHRQQQRLLATAGFEPALTADARLRPIADVRSAIRTLRLVTTQLQTSVTHTMADQNWRGTATAHVTAPVTLHYGIDLDKLDDGDVSPGILPGTLRIRLPRPERIATEVDMAGRTEDVVVTGLRFRTRAGEYLLGLARVGVQVAARELTLPVAEQHEIAATALAQCRKLVQQLLGSEAQVDVAYRDE